jgi:hypothetical protein
MAFVLKGEVQIDGSKATAGLRGVQQQATKTANTFKQSDVSAQKLGKTLVGLGLNASKAGTSLGMLARLGTGGIFGYAVIGSMNKFGDAVKQASTDYYSAQKDLADAFETSFKSTSVEQARAGLEKTQDTIESLRGKITQLGASGGILKALEKFPGINLGVGDTERALAQAQNQLLVQEEIVKLKQEEQKFTEGIQSETRAIVLQSKINQENLKAELEIYGLQDVGVKLAKEELAQANALYDENSRILSKLIETNREESNKEAIKDRQIQKAQLEFGILKANLNIQKEEARLQEKQSKQAQQAGGGLLGASSAGRQALDVARKQRAAQVKTEDFKTQDKFFNQMRDEENKKRAERGLAPVTAQRMRERVAAQQVAGEMPSLGERLQGGISGIDPSQLAREAAASKFEMDRMVGVPGRGMAGGTSSDAKLGEEQSTLSKETLKAIQTLVELMKSGTVVK